MDLKWASTDLVLDQYLSPVWNYYIDGSIRKSNEFTLQRATAINFDETKCGTLLFEVSNVDQLTNAPSAYVTFPGATADVVYLTYNSTWFLPSPYMNSIVFTVKAYYADYPSNFVTKTFTVNELDCSVRFKAVTQTEPLLYFMNPVLSATLPASKYYKFNSNPSTPGVCL